MRSGARGVVIIPAHDEAGVISATLRPLAPLAAAGTVEVVVAANGCTDETVERASGIPGVRVLDLPVGSKTRALSAADRLVDRWPRLYLDADITITPDAVLEVFDVLERGEVPAARPAYRYDTLGATWLVRAFYRARSRLPEASSHLWGAGAYALSEAGRGRFADFPDVTADDLWVDLLFGADEKTVVDTDPVVVRTPRTLGGLMAVLRRTYLGNGELSRAGDEREPDTTASTLRQLVGSVDSARSLLDAAVYTGLVLAGRVLARRRGERWDRDDSSRLATT